LARGAYAVLSPIEGAGEKERDLGSS
jgi:hypothetical protein